MLARTLRRFSSAADLLRPAAFFRTLARVDQLVDANRELGVAVRELRVRTEQLLTIHQLDAEQRFELRELPKQLDVDRIDAWVAGAVAAAPLRDDPFPHVVIEEWLPRDVYASVIRGLPPAIFFADREERRHRLPVPFPLAPAYSQYVWRFVAQEIVGRVLHRALNRKFSDTIRTYVRSFVPELPDTIDLTLHPSDGRIMLRRPGYVIEPHRDPKWGFVTGLVYLARDADSEAHGTQLYRVNEDIEAPDGKPFYVDPCRCQLARAVPFRANTMLAFLNSAGAHGASIPVDAQPPDLERYVYQFRLGPDNRTIRKLLSLMPAERRARWGGMKAAKAAGQES